MAADGTTASGTAERPVGPAAARRPSGTWVMEHRAVDAEAMMENRTYDEIAVGDSASLTRTLTPEDIELFAALSGDASPARTDPAAMEPGRPQPAAAPLQRAIAHDLWGSGLIAAVLGSELPGPGTHYLGQTLRFLRPLAPGDVVTATVTVTAKSDRGRVTVGCRCTDQDGAEVIVGEAEVSAPAEKLRRLRSSPPEFRVQGHRRFRDLLDRAAAGAPATVAVAHPCDESALRAAAEAAEAGLVTPILVGPEGRIRAAAEAAGIDISAFRLEPAPHSHAAAERAVALVAAREAELLMKGSLHTDELMSAVLAPAAGLRTGRRISHVYVMDVPGYPRPLLVTDAAINIEPTLEDKADIIRNAIDLAHVLGIARPRVAILAAVETVSAKMPSTLDAAALCKMADRGQILGARLDGPLAFDNAVSEAAARSKGIVSEVAGRADILLAPNLEAGNMIAKQLTFLSGADAAGVVLGARVPIVLTSRADSVRTRLASAAVAVLLARAATLATPGVAP